MQLRVDGRLATVQGELLVATPGKPDFVASRHQVTWDDGSAVSDADRAAILRVAQEAGRRRKLTVEIV
jgi:hypothetical protein